AARSVPAIRAGAGAEVEGRRVRRGRGVDGTARAQARLSRRISSARNAARIFAEGPGGARNSPARTRAREAARQRAHAVGAHAGARNSTVAVGAGKYARFLDWPSATSQDRQSDENKKSPRRRRFEAAASDVRDDAARLPAGARVRRPGGAGPPRGAQ